MSSRFYSLASTSFLQFLIRSTKKLRSLEPQDLGRMAISMNKIGCVPTPEWAEAFWKTTSEKVSGQDNHTVIMVIGNEVRRSRPCNAKVEYNSIYNSRK